VIFLIFYSKSTPYTTIYTRSRGSIIHPLYSTNPSLYRSTTEPRDGKCVGGQGAEGGWWELIEPFINICTPSDIGM
jgi:hypothetical protein